MTTPELSLPAHLAEYLELSGAEARKLDRSAKELEIVSTLLRAGLTDAEVASWFAQHRPHKYAQEPTPESWLGSLIATARKSNQTYAASQTKDGDTHTHHTRVNANDQHPVKLPQSAALPWAVLKAMREAEEAPEPPPDLTRWRQQIVAISTRLQGWPVSLKTAQRLSENLIKYGYVQAQRVDGRSKSPRLTEKGRAASVPVRGKWSRAITLSQRPAPEPDEPIESEEQEPEPTGSSRTRSSRPPRSAEQQRLSRVTGHRKNNLINGHYRLSFEGNRIRHIQLLTAPEDWVTARIWPQLITGFDEDAPPRFTTILSPEDPTIAEPDPLRTIMPSARKPRDMTFAAGVELTKTKTGFELAHYRDEAGEEHAALGVIMQSPANFFGPLSRLGRHDRVIRVKGVGATRPKEGQEWRSYRFEESGEPLVLTGVSFDFDGLLETLEDPNHLMRALRLPRGWFLMPPKRQALVKRLLAANESASS